MRVTKLGHACVRLEHDGRALVVDPGGFTEPDAAAGADTVLVTHEHPDHLDPERLRRTDAPIWTNAAVRDALAAQAPELAERVRVVTAGDAFEAAGFAVSVHGTTHEVIHPDIPRIANTAYLVEEEVFHPGDSWTAPPQPVPTLLVPVYAPWMRIAQAVDFARSHAPGTAVAIHDGMLNDNGLAVVDRVMRGLLEPAGIEYARLGAGSEL